MENPLTTTDGHSLQMASTTPVGFRKAWALLHEVQVSIMVSIISIFKPFDYVVS
jgi:hypothetical protein